jgi:nucleoside-diphosphate-sugar epimerase
VAAEKLVLDSHRNSRLAVTVIRPGFVYGPRCQHLLPFFKSLKQGWFVIVGKGEAFVHPIFISDLVDSLILAAEKSPESTGKTYLIVGERCVTVNELIAIIRRYMGKGGTGMHIPYSLGWAGAVLCEALAGIFRVSPPLTKSRVKFFNEHRAFTWEKAAQELSYRPSVTLEEGIPSTIKWYRDNGLL